ncbi:TRAP-type C4-dicarboxylate transport system, small permease component [Hartmannibacter diazotrophicus]|uniref:TRAP transporter small permease protein n=1 Tax=Hartmannibacter diazotrophicus TaxID=1482074 RepID=A0A2C9DAN5_9HYPH|nr:TRAP transporter small permease [Hartmannibacter diazotrophicus]SON56665.1 TRAP-type C4-dicarboxylate transport system, small permease component [Hartmannibacter diazotrophicus]
MMLRRLDRIVEAAAVTIFAASFLLICANVLNRYIVLTWLRALAKNDESFRPAYFAIREAVSTVTSTADEVPGLLLVWIAFLGAYLALRGNGHIAFDLFLDKLAPRARQIAEGAIALLMSGFFVMLFWESVRMIMVAGQTEIATAAIARGWFMLIMPISAVLMLIAVAARFFRAAQPEERR